MTDKLKKKPIPMAVDPLSQDAAGEKKTRKKKELIINYFWLQV